MEEEKRYIENKYPNYEATKFNIFVYHINSLGILIESTFLNYKWITIHYYLLRCGKFLQIGESGRCY